MGDLKVVPSSYEVDGLEAMIGECLYMVFELHVEMFLVAFVRPRVRAPPDRRGAGSARGYGA